MKPDSDNLHQLMIELITDEISPKDRQYLLELLESDAMVKHVYNQLLAQYSPSDLATNFQRFKANDYWKDIPATVVHKQKRAWVITLRRSGMAAAAVLIGLLLFTYYGSRSRKVRLQLDSVNEVTSTSPPAVKLQLATGEMIDLSSSKGQVLASSATLNNTGNSLTYTANAGQSVADNILTVPVGLDYKIVLSDGSVLWLNSATQLQFPFQFTGSSREITINGEAYLQVAKNPDKPFVVHTSQGSICVLGTSFNVNTYDNHELRVALVTGSVKVQSPVEELIIKPGEEVVYSSSQKRLNIQEFDEEEVLSWRQGIHYFHNTTVHEIRQVFPRWYGVPIVVDNRELEQRQFTGILNRNEPFTNFLNSLKATTAINDYYYKDGVLHLK